MKREACDRAWQVEAVRDGRLSGTEVDELASHLTVCSSCYSEQHKLDVLASDLRARSTDVDEVALRRLRHTTLEKANALMTASTTPTWRQRAAGWPATACLLITVVASTLWFARADRSGAPHSAVSVIADHKARWQRSLDRHVERVDLSSGTLLFRVARKPTDPRLVVRVPDGVIEDLGTVFSVSVRDGTTREIVVREGAVMFHRRGDSALHLKAGAIWTAPEAPSPVQPLPFASPREPARVEAPVALPKNAQTSRLERRGGGLPRRARLSVHPAHELSDSGEDAAYMELLALLHAGRSAEARVAARAYLEAFPAGFRRLEVTRVAGLATVQPGKTGPGSR